MSTAQDTIGKLIGMEQQRDAIHIAMAPVIAGEPLRPGQAVAFEEGSTERVRSYGTTIGIVDPFLPQMVEAGQRFWMMLYPNTITALRHEWTHPAFTDVAPLPKKDGVSTEMAESQKWIEKFAEEIDQTYNRLMDAANNWVQFGDYTYDNTESYKDSWDKFPEFWKHYEIVIGEKVGDKAEPFFTCSC